MKVKFKDWLCDAKVAYYYGGRIAILLIDAEDGSPIATATVNIPEHPLGPDEVIVKDYSENEGMLEALQTAGIVKEVVGSAQAGYVMCPVAKLAEAFTAGRQG